MTGEFKGSICLSYPSRTMKGKGVAWFDYLLDPIKPLTFIDSQGMLYRPAGSGTTNFGSVPQIFQSCVSILACPCSYVFHDSAFTNRGLWISNDFGATWTFREIDEESANEMLFDMSESEGVSWFERETMYLGVAIGGSAVWNEHTSPFPLDPAPPFLPVKFN